MATRRGIIAMLSAAALLFPRAAWAQADDPEEDPGPPATPTWHIIVDGATMGPVQLDPPFLPAAPGPLAVHYVWQDADRIGMWWESTLTGEGEPKTVVLTATYPKQKKPAARYTLDGARLRQLKGPTLTRSGGYDGPTTVVLTYTTIRLDTTIRTKKKKRFFLF